MGKNHSRMHLTTASLQVLGAGALAGAVSWWLILPVDLIKSKLQCQSFDAPPVYSGNRPPQYVSVFFLQ